MASIHDDRGDTDDDDKCLLITPTELTTKRRNVPPADVRGESETRLVFRSSVESSEDNEQGDHCHKRNSTADKMDRRARKRLILASVLCLSFMIAEIVGGFLANSLAIATDAAHLATDFASFMISLFSIVMAARPPTKRMSFGWYRAEVMGALLSVLLIWVVTGILFYTAVQRAISNDFEIDANVMLITAGVGVAFNLLMGITLHDSHTHSHGGGGSHSHGGGGSSYSHSRRRRSSHGHVHPGRATSAGHSHGNALSEPSVSGHGKCQARNDSSEAVEHSHENGLLPDEQQGNKHSHGGAGGHEEVVTMHYEDHDRNEDHDHSHNNGHNHSHEHDQDAMNLFRQNTPSSPNCGIPTTSNNNIPTTTMTVLIDAELLTPIDQPVSVRSNYGSTGHRVSLDGGQPPCSSGGVYDDDTMSEESDVVEKENQSNINVRAAFIHVVGDMVQSIGVLIAAYIIWYKPEWKLADPICTFIFSFLVLFTTITILRDILVVLMEGTPRGISFNEVKECLCGIDGVRELHNLRLWSLTVSKTAMSVHLALDKSANAQLVLAIAGRMMHDKFGVYECTVQIENYVDEMDDCVQCQEPSD